MKNYIVKTQCGKEIVIRANSKFLAALEAKKHFPKDSVVLTSSEIEVIFHTSIGKDDFINISKTEAVKLLRKHTGLNLLSAHEIVTKLSWHN